MAAYCTLTQARDAGAAGDDATVLAAIEDASERIDRYTRSVFDQRALTVEADVSSTGYARLPLPALSLSAVSYVTAGTDTPPALPATTYTLSQASRPGDTDSIQLHAGGFGYQLDTVVGSESYRRYDYAGSARRRVTVAGVFGRASVPATVQRAAAMLAAYLTGGDTGSSATNVEGDVTLPPQVPSLSGPDGTGLDEADALLRPYRRGLVRIS